MLEISQQRCASFSTVPLELLCEILRHLSPTELFLNIRPTSQRFKSAAVSLIREQLFCGSVCELELNPSYVMRVHHHRVVQCHSMKRTSHREDICIWAGDAAQYKDEWSRVDWYTREIELIPKPLWIWQKIYKQYCDHCTWWELVSGNPQTGSTGDWLEDICSEMRRQSRGTDDHPPWKVEFSTKLEEGKTKFLAVVTLPLSALVHMYSLYDEFGRQSVPITSGSLEEQCPYRRAPLSQLRKRKRESVKWNSFVESLINR